MAMRVTRWSPDTCGCVLEYEWDDSVDENHRTHSANKIVTACEAHKGEVDKHVHFATVHGENTHKNEVHKTILENSPALTEEVLDAEGNPHKEFKKGVKFEFAYDGDRKLQVDLIGATVQEKEDAMFVCQGVLGAGKVSLK